MSWREREREDVERQQQLRRRSRHCRWMSNSNENVAGAYNSTFAIQINGILA